MYERPCKYSKNDKDMPKDKGSSLEGVLLAKPMEKVCVCVCGVG